MSKPYFAKKQKKILAEAAIIAEELIVNYFCLSAAQWKRMPYEVKTITELHTKEVPPVSAFAQLLLYTVALENKKRGADCPQLYKICLNDPKILSASQAGTQSLLMPLLIYIMTHELVHIVRFSKFYHLPQSLKNREEEERRVEEITEQILVPVKVSGMRETIQNFSQISSEIDNRLSPLPFYSVCRI